MPLLSQINCLQQLQVQFGTFNNLNECYMKMSTVVYSIRQQQKMMCFLLPVDSKATADKMSVNKSKASFEIEQCLIFAVMCRPFWKWNFSMPESIQDIIIYLHMKFLWNRTMSNLCGIVVAILKMATSRNFSMSGINSGHHNLPTYEMALKSDNVEFVRYCGGHFENVDR